MKRTAFKMNELSLSLAYDVIFINDLDASKFHHAYVMVYFLQYASILKYLFSVPLYSGADM